MKPMLLMDPATALAIASIGGLAASIGGTAFGAVSADRQADDLEQERQKKEGEEQSLFAQAEKEKRNKKILEKEAILRDEQRRKVRTAQTSAGGVDSTIKTSPLGAPTSSRGGERKLLLGL